MNIRIGMALALAAALAACARAEGGGGMRPDDKAATGAANGKVSALLLLDEQYGANFMIEDEIPSILEQLRGFGWDLTTAAPGPEIFPCAWGSRNAGQKPFHADITVRDLGDPSRFDVVILLPGKSQANLQADPEVLDYLRRAAGRGTVIAAWCRSSRILAKAGVLEGVHVVGKPEYRAEYETAGAFPAEVPSQEETPPPVSDRGIVTTLRSKFYRTAMCEEIRKTVESSVPRLSREREPPASRASSLAVAFLARSGQETEARILVESLRSFGGSLKDVPVSVLSPEDSPLRDGPEKDALERLGAEFVPFRGDPKTMAFPLSDKAAAAAEAERRTEGRADALAWLDVDTVFLAEPGDFLLSPGIALAGRPVHHRLIGSPYDEPPSPLWRRLYEAEDVPDSNLYPMVSVVDRQRIRPYYNAGCLVVRPERRVLRTWYADLARLVRDPAVIEESSKVPRGSLFLHQAVLSAVILSRIPKEQIAELPFRYNYPLALHRNCPEDLRPASWNALATLRYESLGNVRGNAWSILSAEGGLAAWLEKRFSF
jgi:putative intracellular protease/amidase